MKSLSVIPVAMIMCSLGQGNATPAESISEHERPNVLLIFSDDHRYSAVHANGCLQIKTPNIDKIARSGVSFDNAYLMGAFSTATCIPSRAMLLTGRNVFGLENTGKVIPENHETIGEAFQKSGYRSYMVGKWHQDNAALARSFNDGGRMMSRGIYLSDHFRMAYWDWKANGEYEIEDGYILHYEENGQVAKRPINGNEAKGPFSNEKDGPHSTEVWSDEAVDFITSHDKGKPFFMYLAYHAPHDPRQAPQNYLDMYDPNRIELPPSFMTQHPFDNGNCTSRDEKLAPFPRTVENTKQQLSEYYAIISHMDFHIGRVLQALKDKGIYEHTIIIFAGDSGLAVGCHGLFGKQNLYNEDGIHVPLFLMGPGIPVGNRSDALCYTSDIFPTLCDVAGIEKPDSIQGKSLKPVLEGKSTSERDHLYHAYMQYQRAIRLGDYKLIEYVKAPSKRAGTSFKGSRVTQLYNIKEDPWETYNLAYYEDKEELVGTLRDAMRKAAEEEGDTKENAGVAVDFWEYGR